MTTNQLVDVGHSINRDDDAELQQEVSPVDIDFTEEAVNHVVKEEAVNAQDASFASDGDQAESAANAIEWKIAEENATNNQGFEDPLKALGEEMKEERADYLARLRKMEDGYSKKLTFGQDEVPIYSKVSVNRNEADMSDSAEAVSGTGQISTKFVAETIEPDAVPEVIGETEHKVKADMAIDDMMLDYPLITHPCESPDNNLLAVHNLAQLNTQIIQLEGVQFLKSVYHSYPEKLQEMTGNEDTSLSSLLILGKVEKKLRLLCLQKDPWSDAQSSVRLMPGEELTDMVNYSEMKKITLLMNDKGQSHLIMQSDTRIQSQDPEIGDIEDWAGDNYPMVKLFHVHGPDNTVYFADRTGQGDRICALRLNSDNSLEKLEILPPGGFKIIALERMAFNARDDPKKKGVDIELGIIDDLGRLHRISITKKDDTPQVKETSVQELLCEESNLQDLIKAVSGLKRQSWHRVCINEKTLKIRMLTFSLETEEEAPQDYKKLLAALESKMLSRLEDALDPEALLTSCCIDGSTTVANIVKTADGLILETSPSHESRRIDILPLRMQNHVKASIFCSDSVVAVQTSSRLIHLKTDGSVITQEDDDVRQLCSQNPKIVSHSEVTSPKEYIEVENPDKDAISEAIAAEKDDGMDGAAQKKEYRRETASQKYVTLRDSHGYLVLEYSEHGQARPRRWVPHSEMTRAIEGANTDVNALISKKPHFTQTTQKGELICVHLREKPSDRFEVIQVQQGVFILAVGIERFDGRGKYQIAIAGDYLAVRNKAEKEILVQKFELIAGSGDQTERKEISIDNFVHDGDEWHKYTLSHISQMSKYNVTRKEHGKPTDVVSSVLQIDGPTYQALIDLSQLTKKTRKKKGSKDEDYEMPKVINIEKKPTIFNDYTRFINYGFVNFSPKHHNEQRTVQTEVSTNSDLSLLASRTGVYRTYSAFDLCQIEAVEQANEDQEDLPQIDPQVLLSTFPDQQSVFSMFLDSQQVIETIADQLADAAEENPLEDDYLEQLFMVLEMPTRTLLVEDEVEENGYKGWDKEHAFGSWPKNRLQRWWKLGNVTNAYRMLRYGIQWQMDVQIDRINHEGYQPVGVKSVHIKNSRIRDGFIKILLLDEGRNHLGMLISNLTDLEVLLLTSSDSAKQFLDAAFIVTESCESVKDLDWECRSRAFLCCGKFETKTTKVFGDDSENITEERANLLINDGFIGSGRGNARMKKRVDVKMLDTAWIYQNAKGEKTDYRNLLQTLDLAPAYMLDTEFVRSLVENFYDEQRNWLILCGWFPYIAYMGMTMLLGDQAARERIFRPVDVEYQGTQTFVVSMWFTMLLGMAYLIGQEIRQMRQLGWDYISPWNIFDWISYSCNIAILINRYTEFMTLSQMMVLGIFNFVIIWATFVFWLRLFESYVLYIQLIKQTVVDMGTFLSLYFGVLFLFAAVTYSLNFVRVNDPDSDNTEPLYNDEIFYPTSKQNSFLNQYLQSLGEFNLDSFSTHEQQNAGIDWICFFSATLFVNVVVFNMLIAIMGDTFDRVFEQKETSVLLLKVHMLSEYTHLFQYLKNPAFLYIATLRNEEEEATEAWEGKIKAINKKLDTGFATMEKDILQNIRREVRSENEAMKKQVRAEIGSIKQQIGGMKEEAEKRNKKIEDSLTLIMQHMNIPPPSN